MNAQTIRDLLRAAPFRPFRIVMSSGEKYDVRHPEMAWLTRYEVLVGTGESRQGLPMGFKICALLHVSSIEMIETIVNTAAEDAA